MIVSTAKIVIFGVVFPLVALQLWSSALRMGIGKTATGLLHLLASAIEPRSALIYLVGSILFALVPYVVLVTHIPANNPWLEFSLLIVRLFVAFVFISIGWVMTVVALGKTEPLPQIVGSGDRSESELQSAEG
jgi:hypothetical protein